MNRTIEIIVEPNGRTRLKTLGFQGTGCQAASSQLESALGASNHEVLTAEFFEVAAQPATASQQRLEN